MPALVSVSIVIIGAGLIGPRHAEHVVKNHDAELFGIVDPSPEGAKVAKRLDTQYFSSIKQMVEVCDENKMAYPDGAIICTPNHTHIKIAAEVASYGIHLLVEKPLSSNARESKALKQYVGQKNVKVLVGHHRRFNPYVIHSKNNLEKVGQTIAIQGSWALKKDDGYFEISPWRADHKKGGGALLINLVHDIDLLQYLFGPVVKVYAELLQKQRLQYPNVDEGAVLTLKFASGACGTFLCSDNVVSPFNFESGTGENPMIPKHIGLEGFYRVFGSMGTLSIPDLHLYRQTADPASESGSWLSAIEKEPLLDQQDKSLQQLPFDLQLNHFIDVIRGKTEPFCTIDDGIAAVLCIEAVIKSIELGLPTNVEDIANVPADYKSLDLTRFSDTEV